MSTLEKNEQINILFDIYENLLTDYQREIFELYYHDDLSLNEIAELKKVSKNAVHILIKRVSENLEEFESKLHLKDKLDRIEELYSKTNSKEINEVLDILTGDK